MNGYGFDTVSRRETPSLAVEVRDNRIEASEAMTLSQPAYLLGGLMTQMPRPAQGRFCVDGLDGFTNIGAVVFSPADIPWQIRTGAGRFRTVTCVYSPAVFHSVTGHSGDWQPRELASCHDIPNMHMHKVLERLGDEALSPGFASDTLIEALGIQLLVELARHLRCHRQSASGGDGLEQWQMRRLRDYLYELEETQPSIEAMAKLCGMSARTLMRRFKASTGETLGAYTQRHQLIKAKSLLEADHLSIKAIARCLGFANASNFSAAFRRVVGMTPRQYRMRSRR